MGLSKNTRRVFFEYKLTTFGMQDGITYKKSCHFYLLTSVNGWHLYYIREEK